MRYPLQLKCLLMIISGPHRARRLSDGQLLIAAIVFSSLFLIWASFQTPKWRQLTPLQQAVLQSVQPVWDDLSDRQKLRLIYSAARYSEMTHVEQRRFRQRLELWMSLTPDQRATAREAYTALQELSSEERLEMKNTWLLEYSGENQGGP